MSKEDMMNKISFALKDPILQMGFEVICSKLSRLEKENAELESEVKTWKKASELNSYKAHKLGERVTNLERRMEE